MYSAPKPVVFKLTANDLHEAISWAKETAAGPDQWCPGDLKLMTLRACGWLAALLNLVENGAGWPDQMMTARAAFLAKDLEKRWILCPIVFC